MYANYHTHTYLSNHAVDTPRDYVESAIAGGTKLLGFSDHVPYPFANGHPSGFRIAVADTERYVSEIEALRGAYADRIRIFIGYEAEYYPAEFAAMLANIRRFDCDYLILGQHYTNNEYDGVYVYSMTDDRDMLSRYVNQAIAGMETGLFTYMAHPDLAFYRGDDAFYEAEMTRLCRAAKTCGMPLEINLLGLPLRPLLGDRRCGGLRRHPRAGRARRRCPLGRRHRGGRARLFRAVRAASLRDGRAAPGEIAQSHKIPRLRAYCRIGKRGILG